MTTTTHTPSEALAHQVRSALAHLYDYAYLQNHPLATLVDNAANLDQVTRAQRLRRLLLDCIEALRPTTEQSVCAEAARAYILLTYRYIDGLTIQEIAGRRALSERQAFRELKNGIDAIASLLQDRIFVQAGTTHPSMAVSQDRLEAVRTEAARLRSMPGSEAIDLLELVRGVVQLLNPLAERAAIRIVLATPVPWPPTLADRVMLRQALLNLMTFVLDRASPGELGISVEETGGQVVVEIGSVHSSCPSQVLVGSETDQTRVGPTVAQELIIAQGGRLEINQKSELWSARITLPAADLAAARQESVTTGLPTVLVIDDNQDLVHLMERYVAGHHVNVVAATEGEQALRLAARLRPQLITLDLMLPSIDGWEILQRLREAPETTHIPVVICSVLPEQELAQSLGAADYIVKPVQQADLIDVLQRWLGPPHPAP